MKTIIYLLIFVFPLTLFSQIRSANDWYFGNNAGVKFEYGIPHGVTDGVISTADGCSTVGDENGDLLFYSDGQNVYNKNHQVMPNGFGLLGNWSSTSSSLIIPWPHSDSLFYIFTTDAAENHLQNGLRYSVIDMSLDGGFGDIISSQKNILLETPVTERLVAVLHQNLIFTWLIAHRWESDEFITYLVTDTGLVNTPVVSTIGSIHQGGYSSGGANGYMNSVGYMKANITGTKIALAIYRADIYEMFDFNNLTGVLSNCFTSPATYSDAYGVEFSPDGTKLYTTRATAISSTSHIYQFDLTQSNPFDSVIDLGSPYYHPGAIEVGPDAKLYVCEKDNPYLSVINKPNVLGLACDYQSQGVYLEGKNGYWGLPTLYYYKGFKYVTGSEISDTICQGDSVNIYGNYYSTNTEIHDTIHLYSWKDSVVNIYVTVNPLPTTPTVSENSGILTSTYATNYQWYFNGNLITGATSQNYTPTQTGNYQVEVVNSYGCSSMSDTLYFIYVSNNNIYIDNNSISIFPNPSTGTFILINDNFNDISVMSIDGQEIRRINDIGNVDKINLNLKSLSKGIYLLKAKSGATSKIAKIVIE